MATLFNTYNIGGKVMNIQINNGHSVYVNQKEKSIIIDGVTYEFPKGMKGNSISTINNKTYIDGFELVNGKWKRTLIGLYHLLFD